MKKSDFLAEMAVDAVEKLSFCDLAVKKYLRYGIEKTMINVDDEDTARKINRPVGFYLTFDLNGSTADKYIVCELAEAIKNMTEVKKGDVLVVGLGNPEVSADALGARCIDKINSTRLTKSKIGVCTLKASVSGLTGIKSVEMIKALNAEIKPSAVILIDTLSTSNVKRIGNSFQLTTAGIAPGSGVGGDKKRINKEMLGVNTLAIGVPLVLYMRTLITSFVNELNCAEDRFELNRKIVEKDFQNLVVSPKETEYILERISSIIADAINDAFSQK